jgi:hypothetical protein
MANVGKKPVSAAGFFHIYKFLSYLLSLFNVDHYAQAVAGGDRRGGDFCGSYSPGAEPGVPQAACPVHGHSVAVP